MDSYKIINSALAGIIGLMFLYSGLFSAEKSKYPIHCQFERTFNKPCPTCGMSRAFSELLRLRVNKALEYNKYSLRIFVFFLIQFLLRILLIVLPIGRWQKYRVVISCDITIFVLSLLFVFSPIYFQYT